jgi:translation initiation factor 2 beta subunit (eIF-2beta)/eIF-5
MPIQVSEETQANASAFMTPMNTMIELIDDVRFAEGMVMSDGNYLAMMNAMAELRKQIKNIKGTTIFVEVQRQATARIARPRLTPAQIHEQIAKGNKKYMVCPSCKKPMTTRHFYEKHSKTKTCNHIAEVRTHQFHKGKIAGLRNKTAEVCPKVAVVDIEFIKCSLMEQMEREGSILAGRNTRITPS